MNDSNNAKGSNSQQGLGMELGKNIEFQRDLTRYQDIGQSKSYKTVQEFFDDDRPRGIASIQYESDLVDLLIEDNGCDTTVVYFHAAVSDPHTTYPLFTGRNLAAKIEANAVYISDPGLRRSSGLSWYTGTDSLDFQTELVRLLSHVLETFSTHKHLVFFGASGGGFAALYFSARFEDSLAISVNPQTNILSYLPGAVDPFLDICWHITTKNPLPFVSNLADIYSKGFKNHVMYLQNLGDRPHVRQHLVPFIKDCNPSILDFTLIEGHWGLGHRAPSSAIIAKYLAMAVAAEGEWRTKLNSIDERSTRYIIQLKKGIPTSEVQGVTRQGLSKFISMDRASIIYRAQNIVSEIHKKVLPYFRKKQL